ncbi:hypothetical protein [Streptomyces kurssanovii]|uniref:Metal-dependent phosphohydrolase n=1 Tax=Streptomyces kurssanovii TaxID=67312 RepID=A0ABV3I3P4_9ACTN
MEAAVPRVGAGSDLAPPATHVAPRRRLVGDTAVLLLALAAGCAVAVLWPAEARGAAGALACTGALLHLARSSATLSRPTP